EDGIRDDLVTGVQTCALPISSRAIARWRSLHRALPIRAHDVRCSVRVAVENFPDSRYRWTSLRCAQPRLGVLNLRDARAPFCARDRKSTRLNSSHQIISYAVF